MISSLLIFAYSSGNLDLVHSILVFSDIPTVGKQRVPTIFNCELLTGSEVWSLSVKRVQYSSPLWKSPLPKIKSRAHIHLHFSFYKEVCAWAKHGKWLLYQCLLPFDSLKWRKRLQEILYSLQQRGGRKPTIFSIALLMSLFLASTLLSLTVS